MVFLGNLTKHLSCLPVCHYHRGHVEWDRPAYEGRGISSQAAGDGNLGLPGHTPVATHRLLIVEDDPSLQDAYRRFYSRSGWDVVVTGAVDEALASLDSGPEPCWLILDLHLSGGDGVDVLRRVRARGLKTRVAVCTGSVDLRRLKAAAELRPDAMLPKPVSLPDTWTEGCRVCESETDGGGRSHPADAAFVEVGMDAR